MIEVDDMIDALMLCRVHKRTKKCAVDYDLNWIVSIYDLTVSINNRQYVPKTSICFVVTRPRLREVFAANYEDRSVHHYIAYRLEPLFENVLNPRTFNCRRGKGQLYGVKQLYQDIYNCSNGYKNDCWIEKLDLKGFFMSINKEMLYLLIDSFVVHNYVGPDKEDLRFLCKVSILHQPQLDCEKRSSQTLFNLLPDHKTLFRNKPGHGVAIGNLFVQLFANYLLNVIDWYIEIVLSIPYHGRYVDDIYMVHESKEVLTSAVPLIRKQLSNIGLSLNENKFYLQYYKNGVRFTGSVIKPGRIYTAKYTVKKLYKAIGYINNNSNECPHRLQRNIESANSYFGLLTHTSSYGIRRKAVAMLRTPKVEAYKNYSILRLKSKQKQCQHL